MCINPDSHHVANLQRTNQQAPYYQIRDLMIVNLVAQAQLSLQTCIIFYKMKNES